MSRMDGYRSIACQDCKGQGRVEGIFHDACDGTGRQVIYDPDLLDRPGIWRATSMPVVAVTLFVVAALCAAAFYLGWHW